MFPWCSCSGLEQGKKFHLQKMYLFPLSNHLPGTNLASISTKEDSESHQGPSKAIALSIQVKYHNRKLGSHRALQISPYSMFSSVLIGAKKRWLCTQWQNLLREDMINMSNTLKKSRAYSCHHLMKNLLKYFLFYLLCVKGIYQCWNTHSWRVWKPEVHFSTTHFI